jgi:uncharacterized membrane protein
MLPLVITLLGTDLFLLFIFLWMPVMGRNQALFGVALTPDAYAGIGRKAVSRYRWTLVAIYVGVNGAGALLGVVRGAMAYLIGAYLFSVFAGILLYASYTRQMWPLRVRESGSRFASSLTTRRLADYTIILMEVAIALLCLGPLCALIYAYPGLAAKIPVHWNGYGEPDRWTTKGLAEVFFMPVMATYMQAWMVMIKRDLVQAKLTIPAAQAELYLRYKERGLEMNIRLLDWCRVTSAYLLAAISLLMLATNVRFQPWLPVITLSIWLAVALMVGGVFFLLFKMVKANKELEKLTGNPVPQRDSEAAGWKNGLFYYNPEDPAWMVEKLTGVGYTYNFGNKRVFLHLAFILGTIALSVWAVASL